MHNCVCECVGGQRKAGRVRWKPVSGGCPVSSFTHIRPPRPPLWAMSDTWGHSSSRQTPPPGLHTGAPLPPSCWLLVPVRGQGRPSAVPTDSGHTDTTAGAGAVGRQQDLARGSPGWKLKQNCAKRNWTFCSRSTGPEGQRRSPAAGGFSWGRRGGGKVCTAAQGLTYVRRFINDRPPGGPFDAA